MTQTSAPAYLVQGNNIIIVLNGKSHTISKDSHMNYGKIIEALKEKNWPVLGDLVEPKKAILNFGKGNITIVDNKIFWKNQPFHNSLATRMIEMYQDGFPIEPMICFMENLMENPSMRSVEQLYGFLEKNKLPITEDGHFLAFKRVRDDYLDIHSGTFDNSVGVLVQMERNAVDDDPNTTCSTGLHFCSESYLGHFGNASQPVMILKINPADVVSIPTDYDGAKGRCMRYLVVGQVNGDPKTAFASVVNKDYSPKPAPAPAPVSPSASWPLPEAKVSSAAAKPVAAKAQLYDAVRLYGGEAMYVNMSLAEARAVVQKHVRQRKAHLIVVKAGTTVEV